MSIQVPSFSGYTGATLHLDIDTVEHGRRQGFADRHIDSPDVLDLLLSLPVGAPVPFQNLTIHQQDAVRRSPGMAVQVDQPRLGDVMVTRLALRPCRVLLASVKSATACKTALSSASRFAPFCARQVVVQRRPVWPETLIEFDFWGVGLVLESGGKTETLVAPKPWRPMRHTPAGWRFAEQAYSAYLAHTSERTPTP
jgi:hypothetical protein